jgi:hypothetical protein
LVRWLGFINFGIGSVTTVLVLPQWAYEMRGKPSRVYPPRIRHDVWVLPGDLRSDDPATDTWEGEAT